MAKPKPNISNIRQGQTIYYVKISPHTGTLSKRPGVVVLPVFVKSQKQPTKREITGDIKQHSITLVRHIFKEHGNMLWYSSKRRAISAAVILDRQVKYAWDTYHE